MRLCVALAPAPRAELAASFEAIAAHLDPARRNALYARLERLGAQVWMSGADPALFEAVAPAAAWFEVSPGRAERRS